MNPLGWFVMLVSVGGVAALNVFCLYRVFTLPPAEASDLNAPTTIEPPDLDDAD